MSERAISVVPVEACFDDQVHPGRIMFRGPFADEMRAAGQDVQLAPLVNTAAPPHQMDKDEYYGPGYAFLRDTAGNPNVRFNLLLSDTRIPEDLGPAALGEDRFKERVAESDVVIYGLSGSIAQREIGLWTPDKGLKVPTEYRDRIRDAARAGKADLLDCDPRADAQGLPYGRVETALRAVGDPVRQLGFDPSDVEGTAQLAADVLYVDTLQWAQLGRAGVALRKREERTGKKLSGVVTLILPGEDMDALRKLDTFGVSQVTPEFATEFTPSNTNSFYAACMERGEFLIDLVGDLEGAAYIGNN